jgi:hypothetical protein
VQVLETLLSEGGNITYGVLFVTLLLYVVRTNDAREQNYRDTIKDLSDALNNGLADIKNNVEDIKESIKERT